MYRAHSKDINRNKSFHTLTFKNLRKVELIKEKEEEKKKNKEERQKELQRDQDEQRYEELIGGEGSFKSLQRLKNIFAAEYDAEKAQALTLAKPSARTVQVAVNNDFNLMKKFIKEGDGKLSLEDDDKMEQERKGKTYRDGGDDNVEGPPRQQSKIEHMDSPTAEEVVRTGFISTSEAALRRIQVEKIKKEKVDPLQKLKAYQNKTISAAARRNQQENGDRNFLSLASKSDVTQEAIRERMKKLLGGKIR